MLLSQNPNPGNGFNYHHTYSFQNQQNPQTGYNKPPVNQTNNQQMNQFQNNIDQEIRMRQQSSPHFGQYNEDNTPPQNDQRNKSHSQNLPQSIDNTQQKVIQEADKIFDSFDKNHSGQLDFHEMFRAITHIFSLAKSPPPTEIAVFRLISTFDRQLDGLINKEEFRDLLLVLSGLKPISQNLQRQTTNFGNHDFSSQQKNHIPVRTNSDQLNYHNVPSEQNQPIHRMDSTESIKKIIEMKADEIFAKADKRHSGTLGTSEMYPAVCEIYQKAKQPPPSFNEAFTIMRKYDNDNNYLIDIYEFRSMLLDLCGLR